MTPIEKLRSLARMIPLDCWSSAITEVADEMDWRPIETAPKDGTAILAWDGRAQMIAFWGRSNPMNPPAWIGGHCKIDHIDQPTHWMPLPTAPKGAE